MQCILWYMCPVECILPFLQYLFFQCLSCMPQSILSYPQTNSNLLYPARFASISCILIWTYPSLYPDTVGLYPFPVSCKVCLNSLYPDIYISFAVSWNVCILSLYPAMFVSFPYILHGFVFCQWILLLSTRYVSCLFLSELLSERALSHILQGLCPGLSTQECLDVLPYSISYLRIIVFCKDLFFIYSPYCHSRFVSQ